MEPMTANMQAAAATDQDSRIFGCLPERLTKTAPVKAHNIAIKGLLDIMTSISLIPYL